MIEILSEVNQLSIYFTALMPYGRTCYATPTTLLDTQVFNKADAPALGKSVNAEAGVGSKNGLNSTPPVGDILNRITPHLIH